MIKTKYVLNSVSNINSPNKYEWIIYFGVFFKLDFSKYPSNSIV